MDLGDKLSSFDGVDWLDGIAPTRDAIPTLVHFWSTGCPLCHEGATFLSVQRTRHRSALDLIAVYAMRPNASTIDVDAVRRDARSLMHIDYPCAVDRGRALERAFACPFSPGYFIFDRNGELRHRQTGNDGLDRIGALLDRLVVKASPGPES